MTTPDPTANARNKRRRDKLYAAGMVPVTRWVPASRKAEILAMIDGALAGSPWLPIETAPKDGTQFQAWLTDGRSGRNILQHWEPLCRFNSDCAFEIWGRIDYDMDGWKTDWSPDWIATHWQPLPPAPSQQEPKT